MSDSAHAGKTVRCFHRDDDSIEADFDPAPDDEPTELTFEEHGRYLRNLGGVDDRGTDLRERFEQAALRFDCPTCGRRFYTCPVCSDPDDRSPGGYIDVDGQAEPTPCHNCNQEEIARRRRHHGHAGRAGSRRRR